MTETNTDRIEKQVWLRAPRARVWRALAESGEFGRWFGVELEGGFAPGARVSGRVTHPGYEHLRMNLDIERVEPERLLSWRWHPHDIDPGADCESEPTTLVVFELEDVDGGTLLTMVESGYDSLPPERRAKAYRGNEGGWVEQMKNVARHVGEAT